MLKIFDTPQDTHPSILHLVGTLAGLFFALGVVVAGIFTICNQL